ncbi:MAG: hypothetical protein AB7P08_09995 [Burkholderiales bacterium]
MNADVTPMNADKGMTEPRHGALTPIEALALRPTCDFRPEYRRSSA